MDERNCGIASEPLEKDLKSEAIELLNFSMEAWRIMADCQHRLLALKAKVNADNKDVIANLEAAVDHAEQAYSQNINGMRDHIKMSLGVEYL